MELIQRETLLLILAAVLVVILFLYFFKGSLDRLFRDILFSKLPEYVNDVIRRVDYRFSKSYGHGRFFTAFLHDGYPLSAYLLILLALFFLFGGLDPGLKKELPVALVLSIIVTVAISKIVKYVEGNIKADSKSKVLQHVRYHALHIVSSLVIISFCAAIWLYLDYSKEPGLFYKHIHIPIIAGLLLLSLAGIFVRVIVFSNPQGFDEFAEKLDCTDLVNETGSKKDKGHVKEKISWASVGYGLLSGPSYHLFKLLLIPAWIIIWVPTSWMENWFIYSLLGVSWLFLAICSVHKHLQFVLSFMDRWFLTGGQLFVSLLIIILAIARYYEISYVYTLLDGAPIAHIIFFMLASYSSFLLYEFWNNSTLCHHLIYYLRKNRTPDISDLSRLPYRFSDDCKSKSPPEYYLQLYSGARFALVKSARSNSPGIGPIGQDELYIYEKREVFKKIAGSHTDLTHTYNELTRRVMLYFSIQNFLLIAVAAVSIYLVYGLEPDPILQAQRVTEKNNSFQNFELKTSVLAKGSSHKPALFVAASGGGTRAAIYTTAVLAALQEYHQLENVVLASGVSGGGMSLAYFAANRNYLINVDPAKCSPDKDNLKQVKRLNPWCDYFDVVADNHIRNVASNIGNTDVFTDTSLGYYLAKSFKDSFDNYDEQVKANKGQKVFGYNQNLDGLTELGLILNTALVGHPYKESSLLESTLSSYERDENTKGKELFYKIDAGGRLIFTNLKNVSAFPSKDSPGSITDAPDVQFKYLIGGGPGIALSTIGALTANFPPVFPNAIVKLDERRFRVTDGGAVENRGLISLLYAIRSMMERLSPGEIKKLPNMHIVMAEASGESVEYKNYMTGITAANNAKAMIANQLILELKASLEQACEKPGLKEQDINACKGKLNYHYLSMPLMMRARGGLGTHWKMPSSVTFEVPSLDEKTPDVKQQLEGYETICLIQELFAKDISKRSSPEISVDMSSESEHVACDKTKNKLLRAAFLSGQSDIQKTWGPLKRELENYSNRK